MFFADMAARQRPRQKKYKLRIGRVNVSHSHKPGETRFIRVEIYQKLKYAIQRQSCNYTHGSWKNEGKCLNDCRMAAAEGNFNGEDTVRVTTMNKHGKHDLDIPVIVNPRNDPPFINVPEFIMLENVTEDNIHFPVYNTALFIYALTRFVEIRSEELHNDVS
uniref:Uncharacterized protein n=1 Tax=Lactuca sativa TaxID=4236 RepID=A0A9R1XJJ1_LACSA|nr:hypothetical protein LSAT_V11C300148420 [Lactuca sativa]